jgi:DNA modification methylase
MVGNDDGGGFAPVVEFDGVRVFAGDCREVLKSLPDCSVDSIVTDPPYGLSNTTPELVNVTLGKWLAGERDFIPDGKGFMGKDWDAFVPPPAVWDECLRVLKPGGHLLAFFGSRTMDLGQLSIRLAGFEIRDSIAWMYGAGFPKSLDVSKAIDKGQGENRARQLRFTEWMRSTGITAGHANKILQDAGAISENGTMAGHYFDRTQPAIATADLFDKLRPHLPPVPEEIERLVAERSGISWPDYVKREVIGQKMSGIADKNEKARHTIGASKVVQVDITSPATPEAEKWQGWGTALKPAHEPIVVARKPLVGTVAGNVLEWGTGGLNIDGSRIGYASDSDKNSAKPQGKTLKHKGWDSESWLEETKPVNPAGRWPANVILDEHTAELLDQQSGISKDGVAGARTGQSNGYEGGWGAQENHKSGYGGHGGASRFFYVAKASKRDRNEGLDGLEDGDTPYRSHRPNFEYTKGVETPFAGAGRSGKNLKNFHPTVKPTALMRYLVKLVTPPGGTVLDPFTGSGSTGKAAILEGFDFVGVEVTEDYLPIIEGRLRWAVENRETDTLF